MLNRSHGLITHTKLGNQDEANDTVQKKKKQHPRESKHSMHRRNDPNDQRCPMLHGASGEEWLVGGEGRGGRRRNGGRRGEWSRCLSFFAQSWKAGTFLQVSEVNNPNNHQCPIFFIALRLALSLLFLLFVAMFSLRLHHVFLDCVALWFACWVHVSPSSCCCRFYCFLQGFLVDLQFFVSFFPLW